MAQLHPIPDVLLYTFADSCYKFQKFLDLDIYATVVKGGNLFWLEVTLKSTQHDIGIIGNCHWSSIKHVSRMMHSDRTSQRQRKMELETVFKMNFFIGTSAVK